MKINISDIDIEFLKHRIDEYEQLYQWELERYIIIARNFFNERILEYHDNTIYATLCKIFNKPIEPILIPESNNNFFILSDNMYLKKEWLKDDDIRLSFCVHCENLKYIHNVIRKINCMINIINCESISLSESEYELIYSRKIKYKGVRKWH